MAQGRFEVQFQSFAEICEGFVLGFALAGNIHFQALGNKLRAFTPNGCGKWAFHSSIVSCRHGQVFMAAMVPNLEGAVSAMTRVTRPLPMPLLAWFLPVASTYAKLTRNP